ncbi:hypothetical protein LEP1GSC199_2947 [Leptospira vanthielii serovar Holland str. Waz Holland = ATCC 700522]|uniref:Uncharacterized protein n=1 Tax=Leptospira vanthielii serovar Holland str. Waz Holland = ATCC 700522 TaxID=1218591 RepID=N1W4E1_9LEPT|nr:hypothetical protein LEP1GSC199_2947 [Leptospira vanthielii serovar Holland str. Waz Holland = ATCC 700522]
MKASDGRKMWHSPREAVSVEGAVMRRFVFTSNYIFRYLNHLF